MLRFILESIEGSGAKANVANAQIIDVTSNNTYYVFLSGFSVTYVLTDFGAARALADEETFTSIYGTEEYLVRRSFFFFYRFKFL